MCDTILPKPETLKSWFGKLIAIVAIGALQACSEPITCAEAKAKLAMGDSPKSADELADWTKACFEDCWQLVQVAEQKREAMEEARREAFFNSSFSSQIRNRQAAKKRAARAEYSQALEAVEATPGCELPDE